MRPLVTAVLASFLIFSSLFAVDPPKSNISSVRFDNIAIDIDDGAIIISPRSGESYKVEITENDELFVNSRKVSISPEERELLSEYRKDMTYLIHRAEEIGIKGAKIGIDAIGGLIEVACTDLEFAELEAELKAESTKMEEEAEELEEKSEQLEDLRHELKDRISELRELKSF